MQSLSSTLYIFYHVISIGAPLKFLHCQLVGANDSIEEC